MLFNPLDFNFLNSSNVPESFPRGFSYFQELRYLIGEINKLIDVVNKNDDITTKNYEEF